MGNACEHGLCDDESLCRYCRVFGYGNWPTLTDRLAHFVQTLDHACAKPNVRPLSWDEMVTLRSTLVEARMALGKKQQAALDELARLDEETGQ